MGKNKKTKPAKTASDATPGANEMPNTQTVNDNKHTDC